jgi:hypothetical protein
MTSNKNLTISNMTIFVEIQAPLAGRWIDCAGLVYDHIGLVFDPLGLLPTGGVTG